MRSFFESIKDKFRRILCSSEKYATTYAIEIAKKKGVKVGENCRIYSTKFSSEPYLIDIGNHVTIAENVKFITHDGGMWVLRGLDEKYKNANVVGKIKISNNVFIGVNSIILPGVEIGENTIIAAGSVVTKSFRGNSVIGGVPAKIIKNLDEYIEENNKYIINTKNMNSLQKKNYILKNIDSKILKVR